MHVTLSWEITATGQRWTEINNALKGALKGYSWVRPLKTLYVVKLASAEERQELKDAILGVIKSVDESVHLVITPPMEGGSYAGWLPRDLWDKINQRTKP